MQKYEAQILFNNGEIIKASSNLNKTVKGELVFNTSMTGYQEILTDPSYKGQIVVMTYPLIGNYGINDAYCESDKIQVSALIIKENPYNNEEFYNYLKENEILCLYDTDTRMLTKKIRNQGAINCLITTDEIEKKHKEELKNYVFPDNVVSSVSNKKRYIKGSGKKLAVIDLGIKKSIIENLKKTNADITIFPYNVRADEILKNCFDAALFSNGPGDPKNAVDAIICAKQLTGKIPLYGICLGHQILALSLGAKTYKLKFGHRGGNHPVINLYTNKVIMTSQNHGYAVNKDSFPDICTVSHINLNDNTIEGFVCEKYNIKTLQFHPEAGPGPNDASIIFKEWFENI